MDALKQWFTQLADHEVAQNHGVPALRILLLERHASDESGWYRGLADSTSAGRRIKELLRPRTSRPIAPIEGDDRLEVLQAGMSLAAGLAGQSCEALFPLRTDHNFDRILAQPQWRDPLLLLMAALSGAGGSLHKALALSRRELAIEVATRERDRFSLGITNASRKSVLLHLYGCAVLCGGLDHEAAVGIAENELQALHKSYPGKAGQAIDDLTAKLGAAEGPPAMAPDLLAEAFLLVVFGERSGLGQKVIERVAAWRSERVSANIIRLIQDFGHVEPAQQPNERLLSWAELSLSWVRALVNAGESDTRLLTTIAEALPQSTLTLRGIAVEVMETLVTRFRQS
ncbi:hypothetical protein HDF16_002138 [Granulicella aggregans]|uniref:Uncharacterized protein n=1 Tax=Granulicella aggregans TaxID=474949 RepID=A0A7W7ZCU9_9BACT|nr:hypothetical protein [Granulicella aggregans]